MIDKDFLKNRRTIRQTIPLTRWLVIHKNIGRRLVQHILKLLQMFSRCPWVDQCKTFLTIGSHIGAAEICIRKSNLQLGMVLNQNWLLFKNQIPEEKEKPNDMGITLPLNSINSYPSQLDLVVTWAVPQSLPFVHKAVDIKFFLQQRLPQWWLEYLKHKHQQPESQREVTDESVTNCKRHLRTPSWYLGDPKANFSYFISQTLKRVKNGAAKASASSCESLLVRDDTVLNMVHLKTIPGNNKLITRRAELQNSYSCQTYCLLHAIVQLEVTSTFVLGTPFSFHKFWYHSGNG